METVRINFVVGEDIPNLLTQLAGGERKRGEYLTKLIRDIAAGIYIEKEVADAERKAAVQEVVDKSLKLRDDLSHRMAEIESNLDKLSKYTDSLGRTVGAVQPPLIEGE